MIGTLTFDWGCYIWYITGGWVSEQLGMHPTPCPFFTEPPMYQFHIVRYEALMCELAKYRQNIVDIN